MKQWFLEKQKTKSFLSHNFSPQAELLRESPCVFITHLAYEKMWHYVDIADKEVGWLGSVEVLQSGYLIEDTFLIKQDVSAATTELSSEGLAEFANEILSCPGGEMICEKIRFWGHSHVNMETNPSSQDDAQMEIFAESGHNFFIRGIFNKRGRASFAIYRYDLGIKIIDLPWEIYQPENFSLREEIEAEFAEKVSEAKSFVLSENWIGFKKRKEEDNGLLAANFNLLAGETQGEES